MRELAAPGDLRIVIRDESWKQLRLGPEAVKSFDVDLRLSRRDGDVQIAIAHKPSDLLTAGDAGSQAVAIAKDLLHLADTHILHGQDPAVADDLDRLLELARGNAEEAFDRSIDVHVSRLRQKLGDDPKHPRLLKTVRGVGYQLAAEEA